MHLNFGENLFPEQSLMTIDDRQRNKASAEHFYQVLIFERFRAAAIITGGRDFSQSGYSGRPCFGNSLMTDEQIPLCQKVVPVGDLPVNSSGEQGALNIE